MKMLYVVNTRHDADAYRVYSRVHMDGKATKSAKLTALAVGVLAFVVLSLYVGSFALGGDMACLFALGILPAEVWGCKIYPISSRSAISLRMVAELRFKSVYLEIVLLPTGSPVSK